MFLPKFYLHFTISYTQEDSRAEATSAHYTTSTDHQKAAVVAATLVNLLSSELSLKPLVKRVNDDLRRDDMRVGQELELRYFDILYRVLHYNRLKLADEYRDFLHAESLTSSTGLNRKNPTESAKVTPSSWQPNLKNVMDALDRMSFMRVVTAIERLGEFFMSFIAFFQLYFKVCGMNMQYIVLEDVLCIRKYCYSYMCVIVNWITSLKCSLLPFAQCPFLFSYLLLQARTLSTTTTSSFPWPCSKR